ncbi:glutathione S-transferase [Neoconidiobolus thromboides FSU 785]|nr:glutathione S-transferase [Neoconidiobolus thromboides FSU 785]
MVSIGRLYGAPKNSRVNKSLVTAKLSGVEIDFDPNFQFGVDNKKPEYLAKFPLGQTPAFEGKDGLILTESAAIPLHIASQKENNPLLGKDANERSKVYQYLFFGETSVFSAFLPILLPHLGFAPYDEQTEAKHYEKLDRPLSYLNNELKGKDYLVGNHLTLADVNLYFCLETLYSRFFSNTDRSKYQNLTKYIDNIANLPEIKEVTGGISYSETRPKYTPKA